MAQETHYCTTCKHDGKDKDMENWKAQCDIHSTYTYCHYYNRCITKSEFGDFDKNGCGAWQHWDS